MPHRVEAAGNRASREAGREACRGLQRRAETATERETSSPWDTDRPNRYELTPHVGPEQAPNSSLGVNVTTIPVQLRIGRHMEDIHLHATIAITRC